ncbi:MAG: hypothetical protein GH155_03420 [Spirochaeta sp.]|nr:hypothetical protein [Spirochaeta sp.]
MKKTILIVVLLIFALFTVSAQESAEKPTGAISFILTDSFAFLGIGGELFAGPFGLGATFTTFMFGDGDIMLYLLQPGAYGRLYLGDLASTFYLSAGVTYFTVAVSGGGESDVFDEGLVDLNIGLGYHALFGKKGDTRFCLEIGPRMVTATVDNSDTFYFVHFMLMFGKAF